jgi:hypothetical protein
MSKHKQRTTHNVPAVFVFVLIGLFAISSLTLTLIGTRVYRRVTVDASDNSDSQMVLSYLCNKIRTFDSQGSVVLTERDGLPVLCLYEIIEGETYETSVYAYQGALWERFVPADGDEFNPEDGQQLVDVQSLRFTLLSPDLLEATVVMPNGDTRALHMALRAGAAKEAS